MPIRKINTLSFCCVFLGARPSGALCETIAMLERKVADAVAIPSGFLTAERDITELVEYTPFEMLPDPVCEEAVLTKEVSHEVGKAPSAKAPKQAPVDVPNFDRRWG